MKSCLKRLLPAHAFSICVRFEPCHGCTKDGCTKEEISELLEGVDPSVIIDILKAMK